ncbi:MAG TPA: hypothetical protein VLX92_25280 [Kofleriaceae bacterium]|nr:hypothetical protein [Kofleriaceae bacterium]
MRRTLVVFAVLASCNSDSHKPPPDAGIVFQPDPPAVYVAKVKNILVGLPPTDAEVQAVVADPTALPGLVTGWIALPQYTQKMQKFFELAFQQGQITGVDLANQIPPNGLEVGPAVPLLVQNMSESLARTVNTMVASGQPLTNAFTTKTLMMTPALAQLYAFLDERTVADDGTVTDPLAAANRKAGVPLTVEDTTPVALSDTLDPQSTSYMHWYVPGLSALHYPQDVCNNLHSFTASSDSLTIEELLFGEIPGHLGSDGVTRCITRPGTGTQTQLQSTDFTSWTMVTMRPPNPGEKPPLFANIAAFRGASELVLRTPHPGFFSTPAFFANWPTNSSNQMRVIANQALIVATGTAIDGTDPTAPATTPGLDSAHAQPGSSCYGCHQLLDPTRSILSATYTWFGYPQTDPSLIAQPGLFAFQGVIAPVATIDDFATQLASHPLVAQAWAEKLCYYANSAPCDPTDPTFIQIVADFKTSGFQWNTLVGELMASPLVTNASETKTWDSNGEVVAVSRRDHLCAALDNRLGFVDICGLDATVTNLKNPSPIASIVTGLPSDGYGRGAAAPALPTQPTLFYRAALENICQTIAPMVIDSAQSTLGWVSTDPDTAIAGFVSTMMAVMPSDPRSAGAIAALQAHYNASLAAGASPSEALQSTFTVACLSPTFVGVGM